MEGQQGNQQQQQPQQQQQQQFNNNNNSGNNRYNNNYNNYNNNRGRNNQGGYRSGNYNNYNNQQRGGGGQYQQRRNNNNNNDQQQRQERTPRHGEERPKKEAILDLSKYQDKEIRVKFTGGREVVGVLKGFDQLMNLVLDEVKETLRDPDDPSILLDETRDLGRVIVRGPLLQGISPVEGSEVIENPFLQQAPPVLP